MYKTIEGNTNMNSNMNGRIVYYYMNGCGHCDKFMPEWKKATASNKTDIKMVDYESSTPEGSKLAKEHGVTGFPSVMLLSNTKKDYDNSKKKHHSKKTHHNKKHDNKRPKQAAKQVQKDTGLVGTVKSFFGAIFGKKK